MSPHGDASMPPPSAIARMAALIMCRQSAFIKVINPSASMLQVLAWTALNSFVAPVGYNFAAFTIDKRWMGRKNKQCLVRERIHGPAMHAWSTHGSRPRRRLGGQQACVMAAVGWACWRRPAHMPSAGAGLPPCGQRTCLQLSASALAGPT